MRPTAWDLRLAARTFAIATLVSLVIVIVEAITDERGVTPSGTGGRAIGLLPLLPIAGGVAVVIAVAPSVASGEFRALAALGFGPWRARFAAIATAITIAFAAAIGIGAGATDPSALFPPAIAANDYRVEETEEGWAFTSARRGLRVREVGSVDLLEATGAIPEVPARTGGRARVFGAALAVALAGVALALFAGTPVRRSVATTLVLLALWGSAEVLAFQAAGGFALSPLATGLPSLAMIAWVAIENHRARQLVRRESWI
jgi:hypothetical protein